MPINTAKRVTGSMPPPPSTNMKEKEDIKKGELRALLESLETKHQLLTLLQKGGYVNPNDPVRLEDVNNAIADLNRIIEMFPEGIDEVTIS